MGDVNWKDLRNDQDRDDSNKQVKLQGLSDVQDLENFMDIDDDDDVNSNKINVLRLHSMDSDHAHHHLMVGGTNIHPSSHHIHMDPSLRVFFTLNELKVGKTIPIYFPKNDPSKSPQLLPKEEADSIPFSLKQLPYLLRFFSFSQGSPQAIAMENTLRECETKPIKGETKFCATSLDSMFDFARTIFGLNSKFQIVATIHLISKSNTHFQNYTILGTPKEISTPKMKMVACHTMPYPYAVLYCHSQETQNRVFKVSLGGENGDRVEAVAVCHMDTSQWTPNHVSFRVLGIEPGTPGVCHFFPADNFVLIPLPSTHPLKL
ncbi:hypothetical protein CCACVL1_16862 [Corchorus capsularis]|uniref:BURP domain-containing protein n=1 Tax=Corchorus capsularis TaxID=210143 RepID=A0A1R3HV50_COCAP|nr:hypothetical protein CCACVL1_16862 [Corchorus capsularis]